MASLARVPSRLKLLPLNKDSLLLLCRTSISGEVSKKHFHFITHPPRTGLHAVTALPPGLNSSRSCLCLQKQKWSSVPLVKVPQIDLGSEIKQTGSSSEDEICTESASEVLQNLSPEEARKLKIIKLEFDVIEQMYGKVPEAMTDENWLHALRLKSKSQRQLYYAFLRKKENIKTLKKKKQELKQQQRAEATAEERKPREENTIFFTIRSSAVIKAGNYRLAHAMQFGQPLVFDMDYEQYMRRQDCQNLVSQLLLCYGKNRDAHDPFHFMFTSLHPDSLVFQMLRRANMVGSYFMGTMTDKSYLDLFPRERLVYLSPNANETLKEVNRDDVYIVGGIVDKIVTKPLSMARAKQQGIRMAKFPLDNYLLWGSGSKSLTLDQVTDIMLEQRHSKDWNKAFRAIPQRKLYREDR